MDRGVTPVSTFTTSLARATAVQQMLQSVAADIAAQHDNDRAAATAQHAKGDDGSVPTGNRP